LSLILAALVTALYARPALPPTIKSATA
jgi:hypothetical protein